jgi:hypothetical protein
VKRLWPHLRAAFVLYHAVAIFLSALPNPGEGLNRRNWADPTVQAEFDRYAGWLGMESDALQDLAFGIAQDAAEARGTILTPFDAYLRFFGIRQAWRMFVAPHRWPTQVEIATRTEGGAFVPVYMEADPALRWNAAAFDTEPYKGLLFRWGWQTYQKDYVRACTGLAARLKVERPEVQDVRCRVWKRTTLSAEEARQGARPTGKWIYERVVTP